MHVNTVHQSTRCIQASGVVIMFTDIFAGNKQVMRLLFGIQNPVVTHSAEMFEEPMPLLNEKKSEFNKDDEQGYAIIRSLLNTLLLNIARCTGNQVTDQSGLSFHFSQLSDKHYLRYLSVKQRNLSKKIVNLSAPSVLDKLGVCDSASSC